MNSEEGSDAVGLLESPDDYSNEGLDYIVKFLNY